MQRPYTAPGLGWLIAVIVLIVAIVDLVAPGVDVPAAVYALALALAVLL